MDAYEDVAADHYAAYRPPLHSRILSRALPVGASFETGLDVGCGTGASTLALADYCPRVHGVDPSRAMLDRAAAHERIAYAPGTADVLPLPAEAVDVATFAGVLSYVDVHAAGAETRRVCREEAIVVVYDFDVRLDEPLRRLGLTPSRPSEYDHSANFAEVPGFAERRTERSRVDLSLTATQRTHLLLADPDHRTRLAGRCGTNDPFASLTTDLQSMGALPSTDARLYFSVYRRTHG